MPARGDAPSTVDDRLWRVRSIALEESTKTATLVASIEDSAPAPTDVELEVVTRNIDDLVVVAEFRDPIYPGLVSTGRVERGGDKPFHTVINAENFHALQTLQYTHAGRVDVIYIDPPYNTGAKDWKYNNDYVDGEDIYRHSKWLAFIERRLRVAKRLLNPDDSILVVTIDEKEYLRLGLLLEQTFPEASIQMVTSVIAPAGQARGNQMSRVEEYIFVVYFGAAKVTPGDDMLSRVALEEDDSPIPASVGWENLLRRGTSARRVDRERQFFPIFIDPERRTIHSVGEPLLPVTEPRESVASPSGTVAVWPLRSDGTEGRWRVGKDGVERLLERGLVKVGSLNRSRNTWAMNYLLQSDVRRLDAGEIVIESRDDRGVPVLRMASAGRSNSSIPKTVWYRDSHNAGNYGSALLRQFIPGRKFPFPKSLYAVEDTLRLFVASKPDAIVVDFFAGSGTTAAAVIRLNRQDGGARQCISITNNEVSSEEQAALRARGLRPGDLEWEALGICDYITKPRLKAAVEGRTPAGDPIPGNYKFRDETPISEGFEENLEFFTLTYESPRMVSHNRAFSAIAPLLWLKAGARGPRIDVEAEDFAIAETYGVLFDVDSSRTFLEELAAAPAARVAYIVTDDDRSFQMVCAGLPEHIEPVRLYESYLTNFTINVGGESR